MNFDRQEIKKGNTPRYLLLIQAPSCHDMDEWMGIYSDDEDLKRAYDEVLAELEGISKNDRHYKPLNLAIWEFCPRERYAENSFSSQGFIGAKQHIKPIKPEELNCFKERI